ncbi:MAG TPA: sigma-70 family RNA polymerase sigma factor [Isosphaeraceae bacterium]|jgi:RNA polymerase sigma-70 factor (ECF subfamily)
MPSTRDVPDLATLFQEHRPRLLAILRQRIDPALSARIDAEDLLTEAFLTAWRRWPPEPPLAMSPFAWLYRIARDCLIEAWRRETRGVRDLHREMPWPEHPSVQLGLSLVDPATSPSAAQAREELRQRVQQALARLRPGDREILLMRHSDELSHREVAEILEITEQASLQRYARALRRLKDFWPELEHGGSAHE